MVIVKLMGGLGNQMFQYATGKSLANRLQCPLLVDVSSYQTDKLRTFDLNYFSISASVATPQLLEKCNKRSIQRWLPFLASPRQFIHIYHEPHFQYDPGFEALTSPVQLIGFFQTEKYFQNISDAVRNDFRPRNPISEASLEMAKKMSAETSVSLHVRRSDYVTNAVTTEYHGLTPLGYYERGLAKLSAELGPLHVYVFSDDPQWCKDNLNSPHSMTFVTHNTKNWEDLDLMSKCKHHIIANSSFSWWSAWLNPSKDKKVIAPAKWFANAPHNTQDLLPASWIKLD